MGRGHGWPTQCTERGLSPSLLLELLGMFLYKMGGRKTPYFDGVVFFSVTGRLSRPLESPGRDTGSVDSHVSTKFYSHVDIMRQRNLYLCSVSWNLLLQKKVRGSALPDVLRLKELPAGSAEGVELP